MICWSKVVVIISVIGSVLVSRYFGRVVDCMVFMVIMINKVVKWKIMKLLLVLLDWGSKKNMVYEYL